MGSRTRVLLNFKRYGRNWPWQIVKHLIGIKQQGVGTNIFLYSWHLSSYLSRGPPENKTQTIPLLQLTLSILKCEGRWRIWTELESDDVEYYSHISTQNRWNIPKNVMIRSNLRLQIWNQSLPDNCRLLCKVLCTVTKLNLYHSFIKVWTARTYNKVWNLGFRGFPFLKVRNIACT